MAGTESRLYQRSAHRRPNIKCSNFYCSLPYSNAIQLKEIRVIAACECLCMVPYSASGMTQQLTANCPESTTPASKKKRYNARLQVNPLPVWCLREQKKVQNSVGLHPDCAGVKIYHDQVIPFPKKPSYIVRLSAADQTSRLQLYASLKIMLLSRHSSYHPGDSSYHLRSHYNFEQSLCLGPRKATEDKLTEISHVESLRQAHLIHHGARSALQRTSI
ncbi:hypothetical protein C8R43DRAFT_994982 [Mycena crocata]|nr:hypothetical protein C8R43DRAFT_994982 [Mycena crocata]